MLATECLSKSKKEDAIKSISYSNSLFVLFINVNIVKVLLVLLLSPKTKKELKH